MKVDVKMLILLLKNVDLWIKAGADVCQVVDKDLTILDFALSVKDTPQKRKVLDLLIESGAYTNFSLKHLDKQSRSELLFSIKRVQKNLKLKHNSLARVRNKLAKKIDKAIEPEKSFGISVEEIKIPKPIKNMELFIAKKIQKIK